MPATKTNILIVIFSCEKYVDTRRCWLRHTWVPDVAQHPNLCYLMVSAVPSGPPRVEGDTLYVAANDEASGLLEKMLAAYRYVGAEYEFDYVFRCDDDTFVMPSRLAEVEVEGDLVGAPHSWINEEQVWPQAQRHLGLRDRRWYRQAYQGPIVNGGSGYLISRKAVEWLLAYQGPLLKPSSLPDKAVSDVLSLDNVTLVDDPRFRPSGTKDNAPSRYNDYIACHPCNLEQMACYQADLQATTRAEHIIRNCGEQVRPVYAHLLYRRPRTTGEATNTRYAKFAIVSQERSGSTLTLRSLARHPNIVAASEVFNPIQYDGQHSYSESAPEVHDSQIYSPTGDTITLYGNPIDDQSVDPIDLLHQSVFRAYPEAVRAVGFKLLVHQCRANRWQKLWQYLATIKVIHVVRKDKLAQVFSQAVADHFGYWHCPHNVRFSLAPLYLDPDDTMKRIRASVRQDAHMRDFLRETDHLEICYADLCTAYDYLMERILRWLDVPKAVLKPPTRKLVNQPLPRLVRNWGHLVDRLHEADLAGPANLDYHTAQPW